MFDLNELKSLHVLIEMAFASGKITNTQDATAALVLQQKVAQGIDAHSQEVAPVADIEEV